MQRPTPNEEPAHQSRWKNYPSPQFRRNPEKPRAIQLGPGMLKKAHQLGWMVLSMSTETPAITLTPPSPEELPARSQRSRHPPQRYGDIYCHGVGLPGGLKNPTDEQTSTAQIASSSNLSYATRPVVKKGLDEEEKTAENKEVTAWPKIIPTDNSLNEVEWPLLDKEKCLTLEKEIRFPV